MPPARFRLKILLGGRSRYWLAREAGLSYPTVSAIYHNRAHGVTLDVLGKLAKALRVEPGDLFESQARKGGKS